MTDCLPRWETPRTPGRATFGPRVADIATLIGLPLMPWQRRVLDTALEYDESTGRFYYREVRLTVPRQSGKTILLLCLMVYRCLAMGAGRRVAFTMQDGQAAKKKMFDDFLPLLSASDLRPMFTTRRANGDESYTWQNGSMWFPLSNSETAGHGLTIDLGVIDEAWDNDGRSEQAMTPAMITKRDAQQWVVSTAGTTDHPWFIAKTDGGRRLVTAGTTRGVCYFEWSADPAADPGDPATWRSCMPALGYTVDEDTISAVYNSMSLNEFKRAFLNITLDRSESAPWRVITESEWASCESRERDIGWESPIMVGVDVSLDRMTAALVIAGFDDDGRPQIEFADGRRTGTSWIVDRVEGMFTRFDRFAYAVIDGGSPAATLVEQLEAKGIPVHVVNGGQHALYAQRLQDALRDGLVTHRGQDSLTSSVAGAAKRTYGDRWLWNRRDASVDICPIVAATLAFGALTGSTLDAEAVRPIFAY